MNTLFLALLGLLLVLALAFAIGAAQITRYEGSEREELDEHSRRHASEPRGDGREFYKSLGAGTGEQIKARLFTLEQYRDELGGDAGSAGKERFVGALKAYRRLDDDWYETPAEKAASPLDLKDDEYQVDEERGVLLLKKLPPGVPPAARDLFDA